MRYYADLFGASKFVIEGESGDDSWRRHRLSGQALKEA